jgi:hypothetical protein
MMTADALLEHEATTLNEFREGMTPLHKTAVEIRSRFDPPWPLYKEGHQHRFCKWPAHWHTLPNVPLRVTQREWELIITCDMGTDDSVKIATHHFALKCYRVMCPLRMCEYGRGPDRQVGYCTTAEIVERYGRRIYEFRFHDRRHDTNAVVNSLRDWLQEKEYLKILPERYSV